jgi:hypothetical protein
MTLAVAGMTAPDIRCDAPELTFLLNPLGHARLLASAPIQVLGRDDAPPARWTSPRFKEAVAFERSLLSAARTAEELDAVGATIDERTCRGAAAALSADPHAVALAVRRLELARGGPLPSWPDIVRHGVMPRVSHSEQGRWFG